MFEKSNTKIMTDIDIVIFWIYVTKSCNRFNRHVWNDLRRYSLCKNAWHLIDKIFSLMYFIKFLDVSLKYHSDLYSYRKNQDYVYEKREYNGTW